MYRALLVCFKCGEVRMERLDRAVSYRKAWLVLLGFVGRALVPGESRLFRCPPLETELCLAHCSVSSVNGL